MAFKAYDGKGDVTPEAFSGALLIVDGFESVKATAKMLEALIKALGRR